MSTISRRLFLEESLLAAAGATVFVPGRETLAQSGEKQSTSPNERLNVAVLGLRNRGGDHAAAFNARKDCVVTCVCDADRTIGEKAAEKFSGAGRTVKFVQDMRQVFDDKSVDIVSIATPNHWHALAAIWAMQAGKDVYVEKPVSHNVSEGRRTVEVSRKYNRICQGGTQHRSGSAMRAAADYFRTGKLGKISLVRCVMHGLRKPIGPANRYDVPPGVDYNLWAGPAPMAPITRKSFHYDWHWYWDYGNGEIGNNNIHVVDSARMILGLKGLGRGVMCYGGRVKFHDAAETPNIQVAIHDFGDMTMVQEVRNLKSSEPRFDAAILVVGSEGYLAAGFGKSRVYDRDGKLVEELKAGSGDHFGNFISAVRSRKRDEQVADILEGHQSAALVHVANISQRLGKPASPAEITKQLETCHGNENAQETFEQVRKHLADNGVDIEQERLALGPWLKIDAEQERFIDNPAADALLTREYRKPFVVPAAGEI